MKISKVLVLSLLMLMLVGLLAACDEEKYMDMLDYETTEDFEKALNDGENVEGAYVLIDVLDFKPASALGYNIHAGEHLNFVSPKDPKVKPGDKVVFEIDEVENILGSFVIKYKEHKVITE